MEAVGRLAGGIAHDFNDFLTVIQAHTELLLRSTEGCEVMDPRTGAGLLEVLKAAGKGRGLVRKLLDFAREEEPAFLQVDACRLLLELRPTLRRRLPASIALEIFAPDGLSRIRADRASVEQVLLDIAVHFASGYDTAPDEEDLGAGHKMPFLPKPWTGQELTRMVREVLEGPAPT